MRPSIVLVLAGTAAIGCRMSLSPLQNRLDIGREAYVIFVAEGEGGQGDLFAVAAAGGSVYPVTYTRLNETGPVLSADGSMLAYLRSRSAGDSSDTRVVVMNLLNGAERVLFVAQPGRIPLRVGWHVDAPLLFIETSGGVLEATLPPADLVVYPTADHASATAALSLLLGRPAFAKVVPCSDASGLCVAPLGGGGEEPLGASVSAVASWGADSLIYLSGGEIMVRPMAGGRSRAVRWVDPPGNPSQFTGFVPGID